jgi:hypothetical protein
MLILHSIHHTFQPIIDFLQAGENKNPSTINMSESIQNHNKKYMIF